MLLYGQYNFFEKKKKKKSEKKKKMKVVYVGGVVELKWSLICVFSCVLMAFIMLYGSLYVLMIFRASYAFFFIVGCVSVLVSYYVSVCACVYSREKV